ncbi:alpha/beta fold hydrolase [Micromonospora sp. NPDC049004]|uniref:alpha/beta fold hydrolase n=1 Tax=Micromonospora sp. NPDC049004 TaxID=3154348 RepID=UPI0033E9B9AB
MIRIHEGVMSWQGLETWYQTVGDVNDPQTPVIVCHGGPGATHDEVESIGELSRSGRRVLLYDQVGNGRSSLRPDAPADFWTVALFVDELRLLVEQVGFGDGYHLIGHSWGGMLAMEHALTHPFGLRSLVLCNTKPSLAGPVGGDAGPDLSTEQGQRFMEAFMAEHVCRVQPPPAGFLRTAAARQAHPEVFAAMNGPSPFELVGNLRGWDVTPRLSEIKVPALVVTGAYDLIPPDVARDLDARLSDSRLALFEDSSHMPFVEEPDRFLATVNGFLQDVDRS